MVIFQFFLLDKYTDPDPQLCLRQLGKTFGENNSLSGWRGCDVLEGDEDVARLDVQVDQLLAVDILQTLGVNKEIINTTGTIVNHCFTALPVWRIRVHADQNLFAGYAHWFAI